MLRLSNLKEVSGTKLDLIGVGTIKKSKLKMPSILQKHWENLANKIQELKKGIFTKN